MTVIFDKTILRLERGRTFQRDVFFPEKWLHCTSETEGNNYRKSERIQSFMKSTKKGHQRQTLTNIKLGEKRIEKKNELLSLTTITINVGKNPSRKIKTDLAKTKSAKKHHKTMTVESLHKLRKSKRMKTDQPNCDTVNNDATILLNMYNYTVTERWKLTRTNEVHAQWEN